MKNTSLLLGMLLTLAILSGSVLAVSDIQLTVKDAVGAVVTESNPVTTCPGPLTVHDVKIAVRNMGAATNTFSFTMNLPQGWDGSIQPHLTLASGEEKHINLFYVNMPYSQAQGKYYITVTATSGNNPSDVISKDIVIDVQGCHIVELNVVDAYRETCQESSETKVYNIEVTNRGKWTEDFVLASSDAWATFQDSSVTLSPQETKTVQLLATPSGVPEGEKMIQIAVQGYMGGYATPSYDMDEVKLLVENCHDFDLGITPMEHSVCVGRSESYVVTVQNTGNSEDTYTISTPDWVVTNQQQVTVPLGEMREFEVTATPSSLGRVSFDVKVSSLNEPGSEKTIMGTITGEECRGVAVILSPTEVTACSGSEVKYNLAVKNTGTIENTFTIQASQGTVESPSMVLGPGETKSTKLTVDGTEGNHVITVTVSDGVVSDQATANLVLEECYSANVGVSSDVQMACPGSTVEFTVSIENTGKLSDTYTVKLADEEKTVQVASGETGTANFQKEIPIEGANGTFVFEVSSDHIGYVVKALALDLKTADECYSVHLITEGTLESVQGGRATAIKLGVVNNGELAEVYALDVTGPAWAYVSPETVTLGTGASEDAYLYVAPPFGVQADEYEITVTARSGMASSALKFTVEVGGEGTVTLQNVTEQNTTGQNVTIERPEDITLNVSFGNVTGQLTDIEERPFWKTLTVAAITLVIIVILVVRFAFLFKK